MGTAPDWGRCFYFAGVLQHMAPCALSSLHPVLVFFVYLIFTLCCLLFVVLFHFYLIPSNNAGMFVILAFLLLVVYSLLFCFVFISFAPNNIAGMSTTWHLQWSRFLPLGMVTSSAKRMPPSSVRPLTLPVPSTTVIQKRAQFVDFLSSFFTAHDIDIVCLP